MSDPAADLTLSEWQQLLINTAAKQHGRELRRRAAAVGAAGVVAVAARTPPPVARMSSDRRRAVYEAQTGGTMTARQYRRWRKKPGTPAPPPLAGQPVDTEAVRAALGLGE